MLQVGEMYCQIASLFDCELIEDDKFVTYGKEIKTTLRLAVSLELVYLI